MIRVYIAGPYNAHSIIKVLNNIRVGINMAVVLLQAGFAPFCPFLDFQFQLQAELTVKQFKAFSMAWVEVSDAIFMLDGWEQSAGAIAEKEEAERLDIPVFYRLEELYKYDFSKA